MLLDSTCESCETGESCLDQDQNESGTSRRDAAMQVQHENDKARPPTVEIVRQTPTVEIVQEPPTVEILTPPVEIKIDNHKRIY